MVRPAIKSDLKREMLYLGAQWRMGKTYWAPKAHLIPRDFPLNCLNGSSGKKVSLNRILSLFTVPLVGGAATPGKSISIAAETRGKDSALRNSTLLFLSRQIYACIDYAREQ